MKSVPRGVFERPRNSGIYWIRYTDAAGERHLQKCGTLAAARHMRTMRVAERISGHKVVEDKRRRGVLFGELIDRAVKRSKQEHVPKNARDQELKLERIREDWGKVMAEKITRSDIVDWLDEQAEEHDWENSTRNRYQAAWSRTFKLGIEDRLTLENPASNIRRKRENMRAPNLSPEQERKLMQAIEGRYPEYAPIVKLAINSGMRWSEMQRSVVGDLKPNSQAFLIHQRKVPSLPLTRHVHISEALREAYNELAKGKKDGDPLVTKTEFRAGDKKMQSVRYWFDRCVRAAKIKVDGEYLRWHDLRHTFASRLAAGGVDQWRLREYMGHQSLQMTLRYVHLIPPKVDSIEGKILDRAYELVAK